MSQSLITTNECQLIYIHSYKFQLNTFLLLSISFFSLTLISHFIKACLVFFFTKFVSQLYNYRLRSGFSSKYDFVLDIFFISQLLVLSKHNKPSRELFKQTRLRKSNNFIPSWFEWLKIVPSYTLSCTAKARRDKIKNIAHNVGFVQASDVFHSTESASKHNKLAFYIILANPPTYISSVSSFADKINLAF